MIIGRHPFASGNNPHPSNHKAVRSGLFALGLFALGLMGLTSGAAAVELTPGDILVADTARNVVIHINPLTAEQTLLTPDLSFGNPVDIEIEPGGGILVADNVNDQIYRVDPATGSLTPLMISGINPTGLAISPFGEIFVTSDTGQTGGDTVQQIDPVTGLATIISKGGFLSSPDDLVVDSNGDLLVLDSLTTGGELIHVDRATGGQTVLAVDGGVRNANGMALEATGHVVVASGFEDALVRIDPSTGIQTILTAVGAVVTPAGVAIDLDDTLVVADSFLSEVSYVDPVTGDLTLIAEDGHVSLPNDVVVFSNGIPVYECAGFDSPMDAGPVKVSGGGMLPVTAQLLDAQGTPLTGADLVAAPVLQTTFEPSPVADPPTDVSGSLTGFTSSFLGNKFIYLAGAGRWIQALLTLTASAPGRYVLELVSGDASEYLVRPTCAVTFVVE